MSLLPYDKRLKPNSRNLRSNMTDAEQHLWQRLRRKQINGWQFYRQKPLGSYIVDFYCAAAHLVVELDGSQHFTDNHQRADQQRDAFLQSLGLRVLRFDNRQVLLETDAVVEVIRQIRPNPPFSKGGECLTPALASIDSSRTSFANADENQALANATNPIPSVEKSATPIPAVEKPATPIPAVEKPATPIPAVEKPATLIPPFETTATPVPPFEKGGLGGINQNPAPATKKLEAGQ